MPLAPFAAALVLLAALMHAGWNALVKGAPGDRVLTVTAVAAWPMVPALAAALLWLPAPARASWPFLLGSVTIHVGYFAALIQAYRHGDLSQVYPLARGTAPVMVAAASALVAGELLAPSGFAGVALVSLGTASLAFERPSQTRGPLKNKHRHSILFALLTALTITAYTVVDGMGVRLSGAPLGYIAWLFTINGLPLLAALAARVLGGRRRSQTLTDLRQSWHIGLIGGLLSFASYGIVIWAMSLGAMAQVAALRETGVIFAAIMGAFFLHEPFGRRRILAAAIVAFGIALLQSSHP